MFRHRSMNALVLIAASALIWPLHTASAQTGPNGHLRSNCSFTRHVHSGGWDVIYNYDPHFCGPITALLYGVAYTKEFGFSSALILNTAAEAKDVCAGGEARVATVFVDSSTEIDLVFKPGCDSPHPEFENSYASSASGFAQVSSGPSQAAVKVMFRISTDLFKGRYKGGAARTSSRHDLPVSVGFPGEIGIGGAIPVYEGIGVTPFLAGGNEQVPWTHIAAVRAVIMVAGVATATAASSFWDPYAKANARGTIRSTSYSVAGRCGNCNAHDEIRIVMKAPDVPW